MNNLFKIFFNINECISFNEQENFKDYEVIAVFDKIYIPSKNDIISALKIISNRDKVTLSIKTEDSSKIYLSDLDDIDNFFNELNDMIKYKGKEEKYNFNLVIGKNINNNILSIYSLTSYEQFLIEQKLDTLNILSKYLNHNEYIVFECQDKIKEFYSSCLYFINKETDINEYLVHNKNKLQLLEKRNDICSFLNAAELYFIPDDFNFIKQSENKELMQLFNKIEVIICIGFICNICSIDYTKNTIYYKVNGYKTISNNPIFQDIKGDFADKIFKIYDWAYNDGNLSDKIGLTRNIITLHINDNDIFTLENNTLESIKSSYEIYLKENVTQYLQLRASINQSLNEYLIKTEKIIDNFISIFYKYLIGIITFIISVIVMNSIYAGTGNLINIITGDIGAIAAGLLISSIIGIKLIIKPEINKRFSRYESQYKRLKEGYNKLLNKDDLNEIFDDNIYLVQNRADVEESIAKYSKVWNVIILVLLVSIVIA